MARGETANILHREGLRAPKTLTLAITGACNLRCFHCWVDAGLPSSAAHVPKRTLRRLIEEFAALGGDGVRLTGGEPLCHPNWLELLRLGRKLSFRSVSLQTNAMLLDHEDAAALRELDFPGLTIQVSLDGASAPAHDLVRGEGAFDAALNGIRLLAQSGLSQRISIFFTEMRHNLEELPALLELADELGVDSVTSGSLVLCGRASDDTPLAPPDPDQYVQLLEQYEADPRFRDLYARLGTTAPLEWFTHTSHRSQCCNFVENPYLTSTGKLYPCVLCHADEFAVQGVHEKDLADAFTEGAPLWRSLLKTSLRRAENIPECRLCPESETCGAGCLGRAWGSCGDLMATDDRCEVRRKIYRRKHSSVT